MQGLVLAQSVNKAGRADASGVFLPGAKYFANLYGLPKPVLLNDVDDKNKMIRAIEDSRNLDVIAYFGHGDRNRIGSAEIGMKDIDRLVAAIKMAAGHHCQVIFYACQLGGQGGFCEKLAGMLGNTVTFWGHSCSGHGNTNPYVTRHPYAPDTTPFLFAPTDPLFPAWRSLIKSQSDIWARFPFMDKSEIVSEINGIRTLESIFGKTTKPKPKKKAA